MTGRRLVVALPFAWLGAFFLVPLLVVVRISLSEPATARPPYRPVLDAFTWDAVREFLAGLRLDNFATLLTDDIYLQSALSSIRIALLSTLLLLVIGYPIAHAMARAPRAWRPALVAAVILPFWTSFLIRVYAWTLILKPEGLLNQALLGLGLVAQPLAILNTEAAVFIGIAYAYLPFMVLPLYAALERQDPALVEAAADLGAGPVRAFWTVTVPLSAPGVAAGSLLCAIPILGEFVIPDLLGGSETLMIGRQLWSEFFSNRDWPQASAVAVLMLVLLVGPIVLFRRIEAGRAQAEAGAGAGAHQ